MTPDFIDGFVFGFVVTFIAVVIGLFGYNIGKWNK